MPYATAGRTHRPSVLAAIGALCAGAAVALAAYAAHAATGEAQSRLQTAALFAFGHGVAIAALAPTLSRRWFARLGLLALLAGLLLFCGSLAGNVLWRWPTAAAPTGGVLMIAGWLALSLHFLRR